MKATLPMLVQDQALKGVSKLAEGFEVTTEPYFLDGPVTERIAIVDFDERTGELLPGTPFFALPPTKTSGPRGEYRVSEDVKLVKKTGRKTTYQIDTRDFNRVSVLATILRTMALFEDEFVLARRLTWAFDGPQILVVPRAGEWANAFYQRETRSLQFFYFPAATTADGEERMIYTSLSREIIAHETAHAILDGIAPDLYHASTPQSLALHEALADLTAAVMSFKSKVLSEAVLKKTNGEIDKPSEFSGIASEFGRERSGASALRELYNKTINLGSAPTAPHLLSVVLSSALYEFMLSHYQSRWDHEHERLKEKLSAEGKRPKRSESSYRALALATQEFERVILAALDFLPPGEVSFADYGRAIIAGQRNLIDHPDIPKGTKKHIGERITFLSESFARRGIPLDENNSLLQTEFDANPLEGVDLRHLITSDWIAYQFAAAQRDLFAIPDNASFEVLPRFVARKRINYRPAIYQQQLFFKVSWTETEAIDINMPSLPNQRRIIVGATLVIDLDRQRPIAVLHTENDEALRKSRDEMLTMLINSDLLRLGPLAIGPHGERLDGVILAENTDGALKIRGVANMLHGTHGY